MGIFKEGVLIILAIILFLSLIASGTLYVLQASLNYDEMNPKLTEFIRDIVDENGLNQEVNSMFPEMQMHCQNNSEYVFNEEELFDQLIIPCSVVAQGSEEVIVYAINQSVSDIYYKNYDCGFFECFFDSENRWFFISQQSRDFLLGKFYWSILISFILIGMMFFFVDNKSNFPIVVGIVFVLSSFIFIKLSSLISWFVSVEIYQLIENILISSSYVFLLLLFLGIILIGLGVGFRFWDMGNSVGKFFNKKSVK